MVRDDTRIAASRLSYLRGLQACPATDALPLVIPLASDVRCGHKHWDLGWAPGQAHLPRKRSDVHSMQ